MISTHLERLDVFLYDKKADDFKKAIFTISVPCIIELEVYEVDSVKISPMLYSFNSFEEFFDRFEIGYVSERKLTKFQKLIKKLFKL